VGFAADVIFKPHVVAQGVDKARLPILRVIFGIVNGDHVLELGRADLADALDGAQLWGAPVASMKVFSLKPAVSTTSVSPSKWPTE
jgi:hypothetical protein